MEIIQILLVVTKHNPTKIKGENLLKRWAFRKSNPAFKKVRNQLLQNFLQPPPTPTFRYIAILSKRYMYFDVPIQFYMIYVII